jgi:hypothetical protein
MFQGTRPRRAVSVGSTLPRSQTWSVSHDRDTTNGYSLRSRGTRLSSDPSLIATHFFAGSRADSPSLGLRKSGGPIVRHRPLGEYGPHRALGAWGRRASPPPAGATVPARAGPAPTACERPPSRPRAAGRTRERRRRRACTPRAKAAASGRCGPEAPQAPGGRGAPRGAPWGARVSRSPRRTARAPRLGEPPPPGAWTSGASGG